MSATALIPVEEAARRLGIGPDTLRAHLRAGAWTQIGASAAQNPGRTTWHYLIPRAMFERFLAGELPVMTLAVTVNPATTPDQIALDVFQHVAAALQTAA